MSPILVDARTLPPTIRHPRILETFDALTVGQSLVLVNDHYPLPLLHQFQADRRAAFDWSVLEVGEGTYRVEIHKRDAREPRGVEEYLGWDHRRLDGLWERVMARASAGTFGEARETFAQFRCGLERHIAAEERVAFPVFEEHAGESGPTRVMRMEHTAIRNVLSDIAAALASGDRERLEGPAAALESVLGDHNAKEEHVLYPMLDRLSSDAERGELVGRMQALPV